LLYIFDDFVLDAERRELRRGDGQVSLEPQVFDLLHHLLRNRDHVVTKDELLAAIWGGRIVSESALTSRINAARSAIGDSGEAQRLIRTLRGRGFRFVGTVREQLEQRAAAHASHPESAVPSLTNPSADAEQTQLSDSLAEEIALARGGHIRGSEEHLAAAAPLSPAAAAPGSEHADVAAYAPRRASVAVMPFVDRSSAPGVRGGSADALAHDVITRLAKLRSLFVIAQGTVFALHERHIGPEQAGRMLNVDYIVSGSLDRQGKRLTVTVELAETRSARIVWAEVFNQDQEDVFIVLDEIGNSIVASIANEIETIERNRAILRPPNSLDAWEAHHRGLWHMYRFNRTDNELAQHFFETAVRLDPTFARAFAGLSFTYFQNAFQGWAKREPEIDRAYEAAGQSLMADDRDPAAHWAMGRALWLRRQQDQSIVELERAIDLSPNFALGHYTLAFVHSQGGDPHAAIRSSDHSRHLSPFDPLLFAMLGARAMALVSLRQFDQAADWGVKAAARPNAHAHILGIAAYSLALAGRLDEARAHLATIHKSLPGYGVADFLAAFQFAPEAAALFREAAKRIGAK
jgi:TolB-like protein/tetratricopeptide (TPR) repeat protein